MLLHPQQLINAWDAWSPFINYSKGRFYFLPVGDGASDALPWSSYKCTSLYKMPRHAHAPLSPARASHRSSLSSAGPRQARCNNFYLPASHQYAAGAPRTRSSLLEPAVLRLMKSAAICRCCCSSTSDRQSARRASRIGHQTRVQQTDSM